MSEQKMKTVMLWSSYLVCEKRQRKKEIKLRPGSSGKNTALVLYKVGASIIGGSVKTTSHGIKKTKNKPRSDSSFSSVQCDVILQGAALTNCYRQAYITGRVHCNVNNTILMFYSKSPHPEWHSSVCECYISLLHTLTFNDIFNMHSIPQTGPPR